ncbi:MAG: helix-turn-helix transcriptional regulator [Burkholderiaceae bacterium]
MPSQSPILLDASAERELKSLGELVHTRRKSLRIAASSVARAADMSRQTLNRIEHGAPSVTMGAYLNALRALGLHLHVVEDGHSTTSRTRAHEVRLADYPQLEQIAWHRQAGSLTEGEAFALYERNWRHIDRSSLEPAEREFIARLVKRYGNGVMLV